MPALPARSLQTRNHDEGNHPRTTALLTAVAPTPRASAIFLRPMASARSEAVSMAACYPHSVDRRKTTIGGLSSAAHFVKSAAMARAGTPPEYADIGRRLAAIRTAESALSQKDWALKNGFNQTQYNNWEKGTRRIPVDEAQRLCALYSVTLDFIYRGKLNGLPDSIRNVVSSQ